MDEVETVYVKGSCSNKTNTSPSSGELSEFLKLSVKKILDEVSDEQFVTLYKTFFEKFEKKEDVIRPSLSGSSAEGRNYHHQLNDMVMKSIFKGIEETVSCINVKLKELEKLKELQSNCNSQWRPPGNAHQQILLFEIACQVKKKKVLEDSIQKEQKIVNTLQARVLEKRNKAKELDEVISGLLSEIKNRVTVKLQDHDQAAT